MPRRKKNDQSPARLPGGPPEGGSVGHNSGYQLPQLYEGAMASSFPGGASVSSADKEKIVRSMQEMFSHLDPEVIYIVLSECDFKVENAMDSLLELSVAAEDAVPIPPPVSGFERTAAALLSPRHFSKPTPDLSNPLQQLSSPPSTTLLTEELDLLVDQELQTLTTLQDLKEEHHNSKYLPAGTSLSSFPPPPVSQQALPELLQSSLEPALRGPSAEQPGPVGGLSGASSPLSQLSMWKDDIAEGQQSVLDFTHLTTETSADKPKPPLDLAASGRPSAFQVYKKQDPSHTLSERTGLMQPDAVAGGARPKVNMLNSPWNVEAPVFLPCLHGNQGPAFITPVAQSPSNWPSQPRHASPWLSQGPVSQAPLKPSATIPKSWAVPAALPAAPQVSAKSSRLRLDGKLLVLLRGAPGSGKSTLARALLEHNPGGVILSTDDYYYRNGTYQFDPTTLGEAHEWNHKRAKEAFTKGTKPIIIDNTNMQGWEMRPYVVQALKHGYKVLFREPDTWWKNKPKELERRTTHNVPVETIRRMLNGYERFVTIQAIMGSKMPERKQQLPLETGDSQPLSPETPCPDLVDQPGLTEKCKKTHPQLFSSLPDVSSVGRSREVGMLEGGTHRSTESLNVQPSDRSTDNPDISNGDDFDLGDLDSELDNQLNQLNPPNGDQRIPDCIVESVMNEDSYGAEIPVAFSESIGQRVRRERPSRRSGFDNMEPADLVKDTNQEKTMEEESEGAELAAQMGEKEMHKMLNFVGDWPSEGSLEQRQMRKRQTHKEEHMSEDEDAAQEYNDHEKTASAHSGPDITELQKLFDLIQTGVVAAETGSSRSRSISLSSGEELEREDGAGGLFEESHGSRSNSEERKLNAGRVNISRGELPDCVLDWKAADSCVVREIKSDNVGRTITERTDGESLSVDLKAPNAENTFSAPFEKTEEENVAHSIEGETGIDVDSCTESSRETRIEADGSHISDTCQSVVSEGAVETESSPFSQEKKQRQGRRSGKQCKLALTFTQNCPDSLLNTLDSTNTTAPDLDNSQNSINSDVKPNLNPNTSLTVETNFEAKSETDQQQASPLPLVETGCFTQTEPQDFALLWRLNRADSPDDAVFTAGSHSSDVRVVSGDSSRFVPELSSAVSAAVAVHPSGHREVPYHVVHEKGTQVEERELGVTQDQLENLRILSRHFKLVSFDTLEDLYDKCHQDLEWTTNLLLDSGERLFRDEDCEVGPADEEEYHASTLHAASSEAVETSSCPIVLEQHQPEDSPKTETNVIEEGSQQSTCETATESDHNANNTEVSSFGGATVPVTNNDQPDATSDLETSPQAEPNLPEAIKEGERCDDTDHKVIPESDLEGGAWGGSFDNGVTVEESRIETEDDIASLEEISRLLLDNLEELERQKKSRNEERRSQHMSIQCVELKLPTELALQLTELFGPVGIDPDTCPADDYTVQMDLSLAKLLHQKWKETIQERQRQASLSFHLLQESSTHWGDSQLAKPGIRERSPAANFLINTDSYMLSDNQRDAFGRMPFMDHWNAPRPHVSLRDIIKEEQALQENVKKTRQNRVEIDRRDGATLLKENQLYSLFPSIDRHFLQDIFRDHNYSLTQTELFLRSLLDEEPVKTVVAPEAPRSDHHRAASREREKRQKPLESVVPDYQDTEDPEYTDFRAEADLQRSRQLESFAKAAEAYKQGRKEVASFYAQQGHLHGQRMREANHRAAVQIFERVNSSLLPKNILDLHGLHVDEAREHLARVLEEKTADYEQGLCRPQLSVITGRGNHSQGGVARIRPAVIDYLTSKHYRFTEPKPGLVLVSLK